MGNIISENNTGINKLLEDSAVISLSKNGDEGNYTAKKIACQNGIVSFNRDPIFSKNTPENPEERICTAALIARAMNIVPQAGDGGEYVARSNQGNYVIGDQIIGTGNTYFTAGGFNSEEYDRKSTLELLPHCNQANIVFSSNNACNGDLIESDIYKKI